MKKKQTSIMLTIKTTDNFKKIIIMPVRTKISPINRLTQKIQITTIKLKGTHSNRLNHHKKITNSLNCHCLVKAKLSKITNK